MVGIYSREKVREIMASIANAHGVTMSQLVGPDRRKQFVRARRDVAKTLTMPPYEMSSVEIGKLMGGRHHTCVLHLLKTDDPDWHRQRAVNSVTIAPVRRAIKSDLEERLEDIAKTRARHVRQLAELDELEKALRETIARVEQVA